MPRQSEKTQALVHRKIIPSSIRNEENGIKINEKNVIKIKKYSPSIASKIRYYWNKPLFICSLSNSLKICAVISAFIGIVFMFFLYYGHVITCKYHKALCTPYIHYLKDYKNNMPLDALRVDYELKQKVMCEKVTSISPTLSGQIGLILTEKNEKTQLWIERLVQYDSRIVTHHFVVGHGDMNMNECNDLTDVINEKLNDAVYDKLVLFKFELMDNGNGDETKRFYHCLAECSHCNDLTIIDLVQYDDDDDGVVAHKYQQMIKFYQFGLKYLHLYVPNGQEFDRYYFDMIFRLIG